MTKRIGIIGSGISGLTCGYLLSKKYDIIMLEANNYIGGHTATIDVETPDKTLAIDTGFIVFNDWTYPNFIKLLDQLGVERQPTEMSFSVQNPSINLEYNGHDLNTLFAQRRNIFRPSFYRLISEILRFNKLCKQQLDKPHEDATLTLWQFLQAHTFSDVFAVNYILPMCAAIWSTSLDDVKQFPLTFFLQFFSNHGLLNVTDRPQWYTLVGGSKQYIEPITRDFKHNIKLNSPVSRVIKLAEGYRLETPSDSYDVDEVILACHSNQALAMLDSPTEQHTQILGAIPYAENEVVLHTDTSLLPKRQRAWASWNYHLTQGPDANQRPATVTYNMNILQCLKEDTTYCVTLNNSHDVAPDSIIQSFRYAHPQFSQRSMLAQQRRDEICGRDGIHFCGAYWYNGFHEDGVKSALDVCKRFGTDL
ncbi:FAD-dependent oxidoreductase [Aestuariibacter sp. AA17]|uniref:FAD-dependent oxidoreductase n=1 Tax=Fluctibacter corallii TaxID=2984329 RepID=A0ABT3A3L2_9ALTE|nr:FAD-dependent oxidoreductase [Aestuariibacter sp. AA17]MCV2883202.1 FAD-dependent oxidoreductase [Aestuariibacter sp. AA17]